MTDDLHSESVNLSAIKFDSRNANIGTKRGKSAIKESISDFGFIDPGILDKDNTLIGGNKRTEAASDNGMTDAIIIDHDGTKPIYIRYKDFDLDSPDANIRERSRRLAYMLNRTAELSLKWDVAQMQDDIAAGVDLTGMFEEDELDKILSKAKALPEVTSQDEPTLVSDHLVQIYCTDADLADFMPLIEKWMERDSVTINIS